MSDSHSPTVPSPEPVSPKSTVTIERDKLFHLITMFSAFSVLAIDLLSISGVPVAATAKLFVVSDLALKAIADLGITAEMIEEHHKAHGRDLTGVSKDNPFGIKDPFS